MTLEKISEIDLETHRALSEAFEHSRGINDLDPSVRSLRDLYDASRGSLYSYSEDGVIKGFITINHKISLDALGFSAYITPLCSTRSFCRMIEESSKLTVKLMFEMGLNAIYFDVAQMGVKRIVEKVVGPIQPFCIYEGYVVCYKKLTQNELKMIYNKLEGNSDVTCSKVRSD